MNHIYRVIFNRVLGCWQAVTELAKSSGKIGGSVKRSARRHAAKLAALAAMAAGTGGLVGQAHAQTAPAPNQLPQGGNVTAGNAQINQSGNVMNIDQSTQKAIINWQEFNVGKDATVNFNQPGRDAATLNRVLDANPSQIFGQIVAPGQVILINPNGAYFAPSASVDVGGLIATTHELADKDFLDGNYAFKRNGAKGKIINEGKLKAKLDGYIALMAPEVRNQGVIIAERGTVALASGEHIQLDFGTGNKLQGITVTEQDFDAQIENKHAIIAEGGLVILSARATAELRASVIKNSGQIVASAGANTVTQKGGRIILEGNDIQVTEGSELIATGPKGGGEILIGGDWQGGANEARRVLETPDAMHQATKVTVEANTKIDASATDNGDGGTVVVWSDVKNPDSVTTVQGEILAKGGENGGDGGQIETSGAKLITNGVSGSAAAVKGLSGEWLFDPTNIVIGSSGTSITGNSSASTILASSVGTLLSTGTSVRIQTSGSGSEAGDITLKASILKSAGGDATLTLKAHRRVFIDDWNKIESTSGKLNVVLWSDYDGNQNGGVSLKGHLTTNGGHVWIGGSKSVTSALTEYRWNGLSVGDGPSVGASGANFNALDLYGNVTTSGGDFLAWAGSGVGVQGIASMGNGNTINTGTGDIILITDRVDGAGASATGFETTGHFYLVPADDAFSGTFNWNPSMVGSNNNDADFGSIWNYLRIRRLSNLSGLTIGRYDGMIRSWGAPVVLGNTSDVTISTDISIAGPISTYGGTITINGNLTASGSITAIANNTIYVEANKALETTSAAADILLKSGLSAGSGGANNGQIYVKSGADFTTANGDIVFWANAYNVTSGTANNEIVLEGSNILSSSGGKIVLAGGLDNGTNGGEENDGIPDGFAYRGGYTGEAIDIRTSVSLLSGGGDVIIRGRQNGSFAAVGADSGLKIDSGAGTITIHGKNANNHGIDFGPGNFALTSASLADAAILIKGETTGTWSGFVANFVGSSGHSLIQSTGATGGGVTIEALNNAGGGASLWLGNDAAGGTLQILSNAGDIALITDSSIYMRNQDVYLGNRKNSTAVNGITPVPTASSADVLIRSDYINDITSGSDDIFISTTGSFTFEPYSTAWSSTDVGQQLDVNGTLSNDVFAGSGDVAWLNITGVRGLTGLTIGKDEITSSIYTYTPWDVAGPISLYGAQITVDAALTSEGAITIKASGNNDVLLNAAITNQAATATSLTIEAGRHIRLGSDASISSSNAAMNTQLWADTDKSGDGIIYFASSGVTTAGGSLTFGKSGQKATFGGTEVLVGGDVYFIRNTAQTLSTGGGAINIFGETIVANTAGLTINSDNGNVTLHGLLNSGNQYSAVEGTWTWEQARNDAEDVANSYLATVTSRLENSIAGLTVNYQQAWLGGRRLIGTNLWQWVTDPTYNASTNPLTFFYQGAATQTELGGSDSGYGGTTASGYFANWNLWTNGSTSASEPNNWNGSGPAAFSQDNESALQFTGAQGLWNDLPYNSSTLSWYVRETEIDGGSVTINAGSGTVSIAGDTGASKALDSLLVTAGSVALPDSNIRFVVNEDLVLNVPITHAGANDVTFTATAGDDIYFNGAISATSTGKLSLDLTGAKYSGVIAFEGDVTTKGGSLTATAETISFQSTSNQTVDTSADSGTGGAVTFTNVGGANTNVAIGVLDGGNAGSLTLSTGDGAVSVTGTVNSATKVQRQTTIGAGLTGWSSTDTYATGVSEWGTILGPFDLQEFVTRDLDFNNTAKNITFDFYRLESWDSEALNIFVGTTNIGNRLFNQSEVTSTIAADNVPAGYVVTFSPSGGLLGVDVDAFTSASWLSQKMAVSINTPALDAFTFKVQGNLNSSWADEGWGIKNFLVRDVATTYAGNAALTIAAGAGNISVSGAMGSTGALGVTDISGAAVTLSSSVALGSDKSLTVTNSGASSIAGAISGSGTTVTKEGTGTLTLSGASSYTGATNINAGVLKLGGAGSGSNSPLGTIAGSTAIADGAALDLAGYTLATAEAITIGGSGVSNSGVIYNSTGTAATYSGDITLAVNSTVKGGSAALTFGGAVNGPYDLTVTSTDADFTQTGVVGGADELTSYTVNTGTGNVTVSGAVTSLGGITVSGGTVTTDALTADGTISVTAVEFDALLNGTIQNTSTSTPILDIKANRHIRLGTNASISATGAAMKTDLWADTNADGDGIIYIESQSIATNGGNLTFGKQGQTATIGGSTVLVGGDVFFQRSASAQSLTTGGGELNIYGETIVANTDGITFDTTGVSSDGAMVLHGLINSGNSYTFVDKTGDAGSGSWLTARTEAKNGTAGGSALGDSYLVNITSRLENSIAGLSANYRGAWIGAYRNTDGSSSGDAWFWADGPESGQQFFTELSAGGGSALPGYYSNFGTGEPNGFGCGSNCESVGQFFGSEGKWNDLIRTTTYSATQDNDYRVLGFVRETNLAGSPVTINVGTQTLRFDGGIGTSKALASLDVTSAGTTINGNGSVTTGTQTFSSGLTINDSSTALNVQLGAGSTGITVGGDLEIYGANVTVAGNLDTSAVDGKITLSASDVLTTGSGGNRTIESGSGDINLIAEFPEFDGNSTFATTLTTTGHLTLRPYDITDDGFVGSSRDVGTQIEFTGSVNGDSFTAAASDITGLIISNVSSLSGLTIGADGDYINSVLTDPPYSGSRVRFEVTSGDFEINGPVTIYGYDITVVGSLGTQTGNISLKAGNDIAFGASTTVSSNGGDMVFWSDADGSNAGDIFFDADNTTTFSGGVTLSTGGGHLWMGGGSGTTTWNGLTVGDGYAVGSTARSILGGTQYNGITFIATNISTSGGDILLKGKSTNAAITPNNQQYGGGIWMGGKDANPGRIDSGGGSIEMQMYAQGGNGPKWGFYNYGYFPIDSGAGSITILGDASAVSSDYYNAAGNGVFLNTNSAISSGSTISITGYRATGTGTYGVYQRSTITSTGGGITIEADDIMVQADVDASGATSGSDILLKATGNIETNASRTFITNDGDIVFWADSDSSNVGYITVGDSNVFNTVNGSTASGLSGGGKIVLAGGADNGANGSVSADGIPDGYAQSVTTNGLKLGTTDGSHIQMYSGGGDVILRGKSTNNSATADENIGLNQKGRWTINAGKGAIVIEGVSDHFYGVNFVEPVTNQTSGNKYLSLISDKAVGDAITISGTSANNYGVVFNYENPKEILATGGGNVLITGQTTNGSYGVFLQNQDILATAGTINIDGTKGILVRPQGARFGARTGAGIANSSSNIVLTADRLVFNAPTTGFESTVNTTGSLTIKPSGNSFASALTYPVSNLTLSSSVSGLTIGKIGNTAGVTVGSAVTIAGPITIYSDTVSIEAALEATNSRISFIGAAADDLNGTVTNTAAGTITADEFLIQNIHQTTLRDHANVSVNTFASNGGHRIFLENDKALIIGSVGPVNGVSASDWVIIETTTGNLSLTQNLHSGATDGSAVYLNAGKSSPSGTSSGGDIIVANGVSVTTGTNGRVRLFTGSLGGSAGVAESAAGAGDGLVAYGSGDFRYNADEGTDFSTGSWTNLDSGGIYAIYREQPSVSGTINSEAITYGDALPTFSLSGGDDPVNGDTVTVAIQSPSYSTANQLKVGTYDVTQTNLAGLGYNVGSITDGALVVGKLTLTGNIANGSSVYGASLSPGAVTLDNVVGSDVLGTPTVSVDTTGNVSSSGNLKAGSYTDIQSITALSGSDAGNYDFTGVLGDYTVSKLALTGSIADSSSEYGDELIPGALTLDNAIGGDVLNPTVTIDTAGNTSTSGNLKFGSYTGIQTVAFAGVDADNYTFAGITAGDYSVSQRTLTVDFSAADKVYDGNTSATVTASDNRVTNDVLTVNRTVAFDNKNVGTQKTVNITSISLTGVDAANYTVLGSTTVQADITQLASATWVGTADGNWSDASNWAVTGNLSQTGVLPDGGNVAVAVIPNTYSGTLTSNTNHGHTGAVNIEGGALVIENDTPTTSVSSFGGAGQLRIESVGDSFTSAFSTAGWTFASDLGSLVVGKSSNTSDVTLGSATTIAGPVTVYGRDINVTQRVNTTAGTTVGDVLLKATRNIVVDTADITTDSGDVILWANSTDSDDGMVYVESVTVQTSGGHVWLGGGAQDATAWNGLTVGDGYAVGNAVASNGVTIIGSTIDTDGGDIAVYGKSRAGNSSFTTGLTSGNTNGIRLLLGNTIDSGAGTIFFKGIGQGTSGSSNGIEFSQSTYVDTMQSANTTADAIRLEGDATSNPFAVNDAWGVYTWRAVIQATETGGGVTITGSATEHDGVHIAAGSSVLAKSGPITLIGTGAGTNRNAVGVQGTLGQKAGTGVTASSSDITIRGNTVGGAGSIATTGEVTLEPVGDDFTSAVTMGLTLSSGVTGLTIGKSATGADNTSDADVTMSTATTISGPVSIYGGNVAINQSVDTSAATSSGTINVQASGNITSAAGKSVKTNGANVTLNAGGTLAALLDVVGNSTLTSVGNLTVAGSTTALTLTSGGMSTFGATTVTGNLLSTTKGAGVLGGVTQTGALSVTGTSTFTADTGTNQNAVLDNAGNDFGGVVTFNNANNGSWNDVTIVDQNALTLGNVTTTGKLDATAATDIDLTGTVSVDQLDLTATNGKIDQSGGTLTVLTGPTNLVAGTDITLGRANDFNGAVNATGVNITLVDGVGGLTLGNIDASGTFDATSTDGAIDQEDGSTIVVDGETTLAATDGQDPATDYGITLDGATNNFGGTVNAQGGNITLVDGTGGLILGNIDASGTFDATSTDGVIDQEDGSTISVTGETTLVAEQDDGNGNQVAADITLDGTNNDFGGVVNADGANVALVDGAGGLTLGDITADGTFDATSTDGAIDQEDGSTISVTGETTLVAEQDDGNGNQVAADITLDGANNDFGGVVNADGANVALVDGVGGLTLGNIDASGTFDATSTDGAIEQEDGSTIVVDGETTLAATDNGSPADITLDGANNDFGGVVNAEGANVALVDGVGGLTLGNIDASGTFDATSTDGAIDQEDGSTITVDGETTLAATDGQDPATDYGITLDGATNNFGGTVNAQGGNITLVDGTGGLTLGNIDASGTFDATSTDGAIEQEDGSTIVVDGETTLAATDNGSPADITLDGANNDFGGVVNAEGANVALVDGVGGLTLGNIDASGTFDATSTDGAIEQEDGSTIVVDGETTLAATDGQDPATDYGITLDGATNNFGGTVNAQGGNITLVDGTGGLTLGNIDASGTFDATSTDGAIGQEDGSTITVDGESTLVATDGQDPATDYGITLDGATNNFGGTVNAFGSDITLADGTGGLTLGDIDASGTLDATSTDGAIDQEDGSTIAVDGETTLTATDGQDPATDYSITLDGGTNNFGGTVNAQGENVTLADGTGGLILGDIDASGTFDATSTDGAIDQEDGSTIAVDGETTLTATDGQDPATDYGITLDGATNNFGGTVNAQGGNVTLADGTGSLTLGDIQASGDLDAKASSGDLNLDGQISARSLVFGAGGSILQTEGSTFSVTTGTVTLDATDSVTLDSGNDYGTAGLAIGREGSTADITIDAPIESTGAITVYGGDVTLAAGLTAGEDSNIVISATENFINTFGAGVLNVSGDGRWVVYVGNARGNTYGDLDSGNTAVWDANADTLPVSSLSMPDGNRYVFDQDPIRTVIITTTDAAKTYGDAIDVSDNYVIASPGIPGVAGAYLGVEQAITLTMEDVFTQGLAFDPAVVSALQTEASALVGTGTADITVAGGTANVLYDVTYESVGKLTINRRPITLVADTFSITYGDAEPTLSVSMTGGSVATGIGDTLADVTGSLSRTGTANVGVYDIVLGTGSKAQNYEITFETDNNAFEITKARLTLVGQKVYDGSIELDATNLTVTGVNGETFVDAGRAVMGTKNVQENQPLGSLQGLTLANGTGLLSNYEDLALSDTSVTVTVRPVTLSATQTTKTYDATTLYEMTAADLDRLSLSLVGGDSVGAADLVFDSKDVSRDGNGTVLSNRVVTIGNIKIDDGNDGNNYEVTTIDATDGRINPAPLRITAVNDAKFVTKADPSGYLGVIYNGFVGGESQATAGLFSAVGQVTRSNTAQEAGTYTDVLAAAGWEANNYTITHEAGDFTIVPAETLLIRAPALDSTYSEALPEFSSVTAQYMDAGNVINDLVVNYNAGTNLYGVDDGASSNAEFAFAIDNAPLSSSGFARAGGYNVAPGKDTRFSGNNFKDLVMVGALTVAPKMLSNNLGINNVAKVYDGNRSIKDLNLNFSNATAGVVTGDTVNIVGNGAYADRHVGSNKLVELSLALRGVDANNYMLASNSYSANVGVITQLDSVTWTGEQSQNWSDARNWVGGALPDRNNVANVVIPENATVLYDSDQVGQTGSAIANAGTIRFASNNPFTLTNAISGAGSIEQRGAGMLTMAGNSSFTGTTDIGGRALTVASANGLGAGNLTSDGGRLIVADGVSIAGLTVNGPIGLYSNVASTGDQIYNGPVTLATGSFANPLTIASASGNLTFNGTISAGQGSKAAQRSLTLQGNRVTIGEQVGLAVKDMMFGDYQGTQDTNPYALRIAGNEIYLLADITTFESQRYEGPVFIGDNGTNGYTRTLISLDPSVTFANTVDAVIAGLHGLDVRAYTLAMDLNETPTIDFEGAVGQTRALASLFADVGLQNRLPTAPVATPAPNLPPVVGQVTIAGNVSTAGSQTYRGNSVALGRAGQTITLDARSGTVEVIVGTGAGAGVIGLDRVRLAFGDFTEPGQSLAGLLQAANINLYQILTRTGFYSNAAISPTGALSATSLQRVEYKLIEAQQAAGEFEIDVEQQQKSSVLLEGEVEVGEIDSMSCGEGLELDEAGDCSPSGS